MILTIYLIGSIIAVISYILTTTRIDKEDVTVDDMSLLLVTFFCSYLSIILISMYLIENRYGTSKVIFRAKK